MLVLGIESASDQCGCALAGEGGVIAEARLALPRRHAEALAPQMRFVCEQAGVALGDVQAVAVDCGPGLYTGLRAGLATAKATAAALDIGVVAVDSLEALAFGAGAGTRPGDTVLSVLDARRGEVFWAWYRRLAPSSGADAPEGRLGPVELLGPRVGLPADLLAEIDDGPAGDILLVGDGAIRYADVLAEGPAVIAGPELRFPSPAVVALLGRERALAAGTVPPEQVEPLYLRPPDAKPQAKP